MATVYNVNNLSRSYCNRAHQHLPRRRLRLLFFALVALSMMLAACVFNPPPSPEVRHDEGQIIRLSAADNGRTVIADRGDRLLIELARAGATGYEWHLDRSSATHWTLLDQESTPAVSPTGDGLVGAPVIKRWTLELTQRGEINITIRLYREWEGVAKHVEAFEIAVVIR